jgi:transposase
MGYEKLNFEIKSVLSTFAGPAGPFKKQRVTLEEGQRENESRARKKAGRGRRRGDGHLNADQYQAMIAASGVIELMNPQHGQKGRVFQHEGASPHRGKTNRQFLDPLCLTLSSEFHWPTNSPDLNVIENLWAIAKRRMATQDSETADELWEQARTAWDNMTFDEINHLVISFDSRLQGVMALHGESLKGQGRVRQMLADGYTLEQISALRVEEEAIMERFIRDSATFFAAPGWNHPSCTDFIRELVPIIQQLPECTRAKPGMKYEEHMI